MFRNRYLLPLGVSLLVMLPGFGDAAGAAQWTYLRLEVEFQCNKGDTKPGYSVYAVGNRPELGDWDPAKAVKLDPASYPTWTGKVLFPSTDDGKDVEWKCIVRNENTPTDVKTWQPDPNNTVKVTFKTTSVGTF